MKVFAISRNKDFYLIGEDEKNSKWYGLTDTVKRFIGDVQKGDSVNIKYKKGDDNKLYLSFIQKDNGGGSGPGPAPESNTAPPGGGSASSSASYIKSPEVQASIKRQAIGHMTSRTMIALQNHINAESVTAMMETIYKKYVELVG